MPIVTISRTSGSGGGQIGKALAQRLEYRFFGREELEKKAREQGYSRAEVDVLDEKDLALFDVLFRDKPREYLSFVYDAIYDMAEEDDVVIVGRGGQALLRDLATVFHLRVDAPFEVRVRRIIDKFGASEASARRRIKEVDRERNSFVQQAFGIDPTDCLQYHLVVNTGRMDLSIAVDLIHQSFRQIPWEKRKEEAHGVLQRYRLVKTIRSEIIRHPGISCPSSVDVLCNDEGTVTLSGRLAEPREKGLIETVVRGVRGVNRIINRLVP